MECWKTPAYQEAAREYEQMNQDLLQEVSLSVPAVTEPEIAAVSPNISVKLAVAYATFVLGLLTFTELLVWTLCARTHEPGSGGVKL